MNARIEIKRLFDPGLRLVLAAAQLRSAAAVDGAVARWLERCAANIKAAQRLFETDRVPTPELGIGAGHAVSSPRWNESQ
jgi:hypothetical protein